MTSTDPAARSRLPILVVGAGPTGIMVAIELLRRGVAVRLIDREAGPPAWSQAIFIKQRTLEILAGLGLAPRFEAEGQWVRGVCFYSQGEPLAAYDFAAIESPFPNMLSLPESATIRILADTLRALGGSIEYGTRFLSLAQDGASVSVALDGPGGPSTARFAFVVGADGYRSAVRQAIGDDYEGTDYAELWGVFDTAIDNWTKPRDTVCAQLESPLVLPFPLGEDRWRIYFRPEAPGEAAIATVAERLRAISPEAALVGPEPAAYFHSHSRLAHDFRDGRVFLAGDAAHASNPIQGHGMNAGIQDAHNLGWKLAAAWAGRGTEALLASYEAERRAVDSDIVASGEEAYGWMSDTTGEKLAALYDFLRTPEGRALAAIGETELTYCYAPSPIIEDRRSCAAGQAVGARAADVGGLVEGGATGSLHTLLAHPGVTVLLLAGATSDGDVEAAAAALSTHLDGHEGVRLLAVRAGPPPFAATVLGDPAGELHGRFGASEPMVCVIRPDGHVGLCCPASEAGALGAHLRAMFGPAA